ncbi:hypothetical protein [Rhizobium laguerreae]|uniref:hypothetical protein n=1 Tax=Rhizobium laguerreae TaxID=1076926 RepID=UPI001A8EB274|nr:hypothetical protein [Rhizobium laguerreae]MBN9983766.1 hypothetical protein [Rhizobium laguerreae]MBY3320854.1 hypothetical protein [Rhizobium laguerreae]MBY3361989.1 hypothetical protein [Rhizobium laguerreae]
MYFHPEEIRDHVSELDLAYLSNKNVGGRSSRDGFIFEMRAAAYELLRICSALVKGDKAPFGGEVSAQVLSFVDDFAISEDGRIRWFEMKSGKDVEWLTGKRPVGRNFAKQIALDDRLGKEAVYTLVVSTAQYQRVLDERPETLSRVVVSPFPTTITIAALEQVRPSILEEAAVLFGGDWKDALADRGFESFLVFDDKRTKAFNAFRSFTAVFNAMESARCYRFAWVMASADGVVARIARWTDEEITGEALEILHALQGVEFFVDKGRVRAIVEERVPVDLHVVLGDITGDIFVREVVKKPPQCFDDVWNLARGILDDVSNANGL